MILPYLIKSTLCLAVLFGFYKIVLESKAMHQFKRFYLLASLVFAFTIPLITFTYTTEVVAQQSIAPMTQEFIVPLSMKESVLEVSQVDYTNAILWSLYGLGVLIFGLRFGINLFRLKRKIDSAQTIEKREFTLALLSQSIIPHSFLKWIFLSRKQYEHQEIAPEVLAHEATHVREKHTFDILFIELLQIVFWFNPMVWLAKNSIKLNHEFLADQGALREQDDITKYQNILLSYASSTHHTALESPFNYSLTKKRIVMLSQSFSKKRVVLRALILVPVLVGCALLFNQAIVAQEKVSKESVSVIKDYPTARSISIEILDENYYYLDGMKIQKNNLYNSLWELHTDLTKDQRDNMLNLHVSSEEKIPYADLVFIQKTASSYGYYRIVTPKEEIIRDKGNEPMKEQSDTVPHQNYANEFISGAAQNGKRALVIEIRNDQIKVNGKESSLVSSESRT